MADKNVNKSTTNEILRNWIEQVGISIAKLNRALGYKSNYCYLLLAKRNARRITPDVVGRLQIVYGDKGPARKIAAAMKVQEE